ncbi:PepSY domain-containing protein [Deefgea piscis]|uniref:PepSY domain-containing protein n=1 Tax=Deefgea piscis TaxID=2739061 RepID=UPI001C81B262|nr:PepSY domain-containing protein [Deefgea piscis]QZA81297.1 PepSY domain-containing protein [Deefgea piscis]
MKAFAALALTALAASSLSFAGANCTPHPKAEWLKPSEATAKIEAMGYKIKKFKTSGECYEIYGHNKEGKKAEVYFDTKTLAIVKSEIGD